MADESAFPEYLRVPDHDKSSLAIEKLTPAGGLTKRELFAAMAMQGFLANPDFTDDSCETTAELSVSASAALVKQLEKKDE